MTTASTDALARGATRRQRVLIRPNRSLSVRGMVWLFAAYLGLMLVIGFGFMRAGMWMIWPFAGLEAVFIAGIFYLLVYRHIHDHELIILNGEKISIIKQVAGTRGRYEFQRYWSRIVLERDRRAWYPSRLQIRSRGRVVEIGAGITEADRLLLSTRLKAIVGPTAYR
jgi:uncharacterized membrane protein